MNWNGPKPDDRAPNWKKVAIRAEPLAWDHFRRSLKRKGTSVAHAQFVHWDMFLAGWKTRARCFPFNTATGWHRRAIRAT